MPAISVRSASAADAASAPFEDLLPDHWRDGDNRRSLVAIDEAGQVIGHCRGIDNVYHPDSRTLVLEVADAERRGVVGREEIEDALVRAQIEVSTLSLRVKPDEDEPELVDLCRRHGGVLIQLMPPWRYRVDSRLRDWADAHRRTPDGLVATAAGWDRRVEMLDLYVEHYTAQHVRWSPAARPLELRAENAPDFEPGGEGSYDPEASAILVREDRVVAQGLAWPAEPDGSREIGLQSRPHEGPTARADMEACLAAAVDRADDGEELLIDSHATEVLESQMTSDLRGSGVEVTREWGAIIGIPVPGGPPMMPLPEERIPPEARDFARRLTG